MSRTARAKRPTTREPVPPAPPSRSVTAAVSETLPLRKTLVATGSPSDPAQPVWERGALWRELFGIDLRTVALFRIALALSLLADLFMRSVDIEVFYTDRGVMPRVLLDSQWNGAMYFTFHGIADSPFAVGMLFLVNAAFLLCLLVGWRTRLV